jgi:hypothetical protein
LLLQGLGGVDGAVVIDLKHFSSFSVDTVTWIASIGAGNRLGDIAHKLYAVGRATAHGTCPSVGIGGHATVGGLGPMSRLWGSTLDNVESMTVVLADGTISIASAHENPNLFFALRGAGASFGIVTEFRLRTHPAPKEVVCFSRRFSTPFYSLAPTIREWQRVVSEPNLSRKLFTQVEISGCGMIISGTFFGSATELSREPFSKLLGLGPNQKWRGSRLGSSRIGVKLKRFTNWEAVVRHWAGGRVRSALLGRPTHFYHKSLTVTKESLIPGHTMDKLCLYLDLAKKGTPFWFVIFDLSGGAVGDVSPDSSAFSHRSALYYLQSYAVQLGKVSPVTKDFLRGINHTIEQDLSSPNRGIYPGYVDPGLDDAQGRYWTQNLKRLEEIKSSVDPSNVFRNPQSVLPSQSPPPYPSIRETFEESKHPTHILETILDLDMAD